MYLQWKLYLKRLIHFEIRIRPFKNVSWSHNCSLFFPPWGENYPSPFSNLNTLEVKECCNLKYQVFMIPLLALIGGILEYRELGTFIRSFEMPQDMWAHPSGMCLFLRVASVFWFGVPLFGGWGSWEEGSQADNASYGQVEWLSSHVGLFSIFQNDFPYNTLAGMYSSQPLWFWILQRLQKPSYELSCQNGKTFKWSYKILKHVMLWQVTLKVQLFNFSLAVIMSGIRWM